MGNAHWFKLVLVAAMLMLASRSQAYYTNYLDSVVGALAFKYSQLTNDPSPTADERQQIARIGKALRTLAKPSTNVAGDYGLFLTAATQLGPIAQDPAFLEIGSTVFTSFTNEAQAEIIATGDRIAAQNQFVVTRRAASNNLNQAQNSLNRIPTLDDIQQGLLLGRQVFSKIRTANRLAAIGEAKAGFAANSLAGLRLRHTEGTNSGNIYFNNNVDATQTEADGDQAITYTYERTGLNTGTLVLNQGAEGTTTVKLRLTSPGAGKFTFRHVNLDDSVENGQGTFTLGL